VEGVCVKCTGVFDETYATLAAFPVIGFYYKKLHAWYHKKMQHPCHHPGCPEKHLEHTGSEQKIIEKDYSKFELAEGQKKLYISDVDRQFGQLATILLVNDRSLLEVKDFPLDAEFTWFVDKDSLFAHWRGKIFAYVDREWLPQIEASEILEQ
jgi:hypothetical protein